MEKREKIRVFTAFSGYDSQCLALERLKRNFPVFAIMGVPSGDRGQEATVAVDGERRCVGVEEVHRVFSEVGGFSHRTGVCEFQCGVERKGLWCASEPQEGVLCEHTRF